MTNPSNAAPSSIEESAKVPSSTINNRAISQTGTAIPSQQAGLNSHGGNKSVLPYHVRKRDKILNLFRSSKSKDKTKDGSGTGDQLKTGTSKTRADVFFKNVGRPVAAVEIPKNCDRFNSVLQLALCSSLLRRSQDVQDLGVQNQAKNASYDIPINQAHPDWVSAIEEDIVEQHHIRWLVTRMVEEFCKHAVKDSTAITEVVLLGPVLDREHYRKLLNCFISELKKAKILDVHLLQGLVQLVQCASDGYMVADDLVKIMSILRSQLHNEIYFGKM